ncbi:30S ribosomal protein S16 [Candidatus Saccharibacteria bacterium]|nr:30S ribosomal protein S16 [Candidatus Saccharibacteria bacterium]
MLVIRLARTGRNKYPTYRIVAAEAARAATGQFIAVLGNYNPHTKELTLKTDEIKKHLSNGAQPSNTVVKLLQRENVELPSWVKLKTKAPKVTDAPAEEAVPEAVAEAAAPVEAPAAEEVRVGEVAESAATDTEDAAPNIGTTETAASEEAAATDAEAAQAAAADAAKTPKAE